MDRELSNIMEYGNLENYVFIVSVCVPVLVCVPLSVQAITLEVFDIETSFCGVLVHLDHIQVKLEYKVISWKMLIWLPLCQLNLV